MDYGTQILHMLFLIIFLLLSFHCTHIMISTAAPFNAFSRYEKEGSGKILLPNAEENRLLLGLKSYFHRKSREACAPSPSPIYAPSPSPIAPVHHAYSHHHQNPPSHPHHSLPTAHRVGKKERKRSRKTIIVVFVSVGFGSLLCAFGLLFGCIKLRKKRKKTRTLSIYCSEAGGIEGGSKHSPNSAKKVLSEPVPDLFYLQTLGAALEPEPYCLKQITVTPLIASPNQNIPYSGLTEEELAKPENDIEIEEINPVGEISESGCNDLSSSDHSATITDGEDHAHSSDDESFHSLCNSQSSEHLRSSNASAESCPEFLDINCSNDPKDLGYSIASPPPPSPPTPPPPTLPPPPPLSSYLQTTPSPSIQDKINGLSPLSTLSTVSSSSPGKTDSSPGSDQTPESNLSPATPKPPPGIPPPTCLPPFGNGNSNSLKVPPPPPSQLFKTTPLGKDGSPLPKLKPLHWDKVRATPDRSTVWDKLRSSSFEFDEEMIESLFGYNLQNSLKNDEVKTKTPSPSKHVLEPKRLQNITILSKALNVTAQQVCEALLRGSGLTLQELEALTKMIPTKEEEGKLSSYKGDSNELGSAEKFVMSMLKIPFAFARIEAMLFRETFDDEVIHLRKSFSMLEEACNELRSSSLFLKLLEAVLKTGNRMNIGTIRGGARAFKLDTLLKLADVKGTDGRTTLLHFVVQEIIRSEGFRVSDSIMGKINNQISAGRSDQDKEEEYRKMGLDLVSGLSTELCNVKRTATIDLDVIASSVSNLSDCMANLQRLVEIDLSGAEKNGSFVLSMRAFLKYAGKNLKELQEDEMRILVHVREITEYFHGDVSKEESNPLRIFVIVRDFMGMLDHVCKELRSSKASNTPNPLAPFRSS